MRLENGSSGSKMVVGVRIGGMSVKRVHWVPKQVVGVLHKVSERVVGVSEG